LDRRLGRGRARSPGGARAFVAEVEDADEALQL